MLNIRPTNQLMLFVFVPLFLVAFAWRVSANDHSDSLPERELLTIPIAIYLLDSVTGDDSLSSRRTVAEMDRHFHRVNEIWRLADIRFKLCLLYTSPSPRDATLSRMPSSA